MLERPALLSSLANPRIFVRPVSAFEPAKVEEYMFVALDGMGCVVLPPYDGFFPVYMVLSRSVLEPAVRAAGMVALMHGRFRVITDKVEGPVAEGDPLIASTSGLLKKGRGAVVGWVERALSNGLFVVCVRPTWMP
ncbi:MAG: hypothetical protein QW650_00355 [Thermofilum sp.]